MEMDSRRCWIGMLLMVGLLFLAVPGLWAAGDDGYVSLYASRGGVQEVVGSALADYDGESGGTIKLGVGKRYDGASCPGQFRLFIPPGTVEVYLSFASRYANGTQNVKMQVRYRAHPSGNNPGSYGDKLKGAWLGTALARDLNLLGRNIKGGTTDIPRSPADSGWIYFSDMGGAVISGITFIATVKVAELEAWYNDPKTWWDVNGDPWTAIDGVEPKLVCDPDNLDGCLDEDSCRRKGEGYWYNDQSDGEKSCHASKACGEDTYFDCLTESQCVSSGLFWYEDEVDGAKSCHPMPACERDLGTGEAAADCSPVNCITRIQCEDADFHWYDDVEGGDKSCHREVACESDEPGKCVTADQCTGSGLFWYEDVVGDDPYCHAIPACKRDKATGEAVDECMADNCITEAQCEDADFYWYAEECHEAPERGVCSQDNLSGCITEAECLAAHGEWHNYSAPNAIKCLERSSQPAPPPSYTPPSSTGTGGSSSVSSGTNWFASILLRNSAAPPAPACDAQHPESCDKSGCESHGFWWYDGACRSEPVLNDYTGRIRVGEGAEDGIISAGDGLSFKVNVPEGGRMYAVLSVPDVGSFFISNEKILTMDVKPVATGTIRVIDDICPYLPEELIGTTWTVCTLTVPASVGESLEELSDYLFEQGGIYAVGSYQVEVNCQQQHTTTDLNISEIPRYHQN